MKRYIRSAIVPVADEDWKVQIEIAMNPRTRADVLDAIARQNYDAITVLQFVLSNSNTSVDTLNWLAGNSIPYVRESVARRRDIPSSTLDKLADDPAGDVRCSVAENPNTSLRTLGKLAKDPEFSVRKRVAENPKASSSILIRLTKSDFDLGFNALSNPNCPHEVPELLANNRISRIREDLARDPNTPADILAKLANDDEFYVRLGVATNESTPVEVLREFAKMDDYVLRENAKSTLRRKGESV